MHIGWDPLPVAILPLSGIEPRLVVERGGRGLAMCVVRLPLWCVTIASRAVPSDLPESTARSQCIASRLRVRARVVRAICLCFHFSYFKFLYVKTRLSRTTF